MSAGKKKKMKSVALSVLLKLWSFSHCRVISLFLLSFYYTALSLIP